jgi:type II secretory pathway component PulJ
MRLRFQPIGQAGFTPTEVLLATAIGLLAVAAFASFNTAQMYTMRTQALQVDLQGTARTIVDLFAREVRRAGTGTNPNCTGTVSTGIISASASKLQFKADLNGNGNLTGSSEPNEDVTYTLDFTNGAVKRTDNNRTTSADTLWVGASAGWWWWWGYSGIAGSQISYYDSNGNQLVPGFSGLSATQLTQVVRIKLELVLSGPDAQPGTSTLLTARDAATVDLRNRYFIMPAYSSAGVICGPNPETNPLAFYR